MNLDPQRLLKVALDAKRVAGYGRYQGGGLDAYLKRCTHRDPDSRVLLTYSRDDDETIRRFQWPDADGALHLSLSPLPAGHPQPEALSQAVVFAWVAAFFGADFGELWFELPKTPLGARFRVLHARQLARRWVPVLGGLGTALAQHYGWVRCERLNFPPAPAT